MAEAIIFKDVHFQVGEKYILQQINGTIIKGHITALIGPSGAGKSTLLKLCNALISPTSGEILIDGKEIASYNPILLRKKIGIALQNAPMIRETVYDNLNISYTLRGEHLEEVDALYFLQLVGLSKQFLHMSVDDLSGGERQRVSLARTLINDCDILLLDEITSALDKQAIQEIEQLIKRLKEERSLTVIWITHDMEQAKRCADDVWVLMNGRLETTGSNTILSHSTNERVEQFLHGGVL